MRSIVLNFCAVFGCASTFVYAQTDTTVVDSTIMNVDAIYARPFLQRTTSDVALGGYLEANVQGLNDDGVGSGVSFQARRLTVFLSASPSERINFLTEIEFENGTEEINIEFASIDLAFARELAVRAGIVLVPIGAFNQNHDGPRWNFVDRPISATQLLPATWSTVGFGALGKFNFSSFSWSYEAYLSNGLNESIVSNEQRRTSLPAGKQDPLRFAESSNGHMMFSGRTALRSSAVGEFGLSYAGGVYNNTQIDGLNTGDPLSMHIAALDYSIGSFEELLFIRGEWSFVSVDLPPNTEPSYASMQTGGYADVNLRLWHGSLLGFTSSALYIATRLEYVDFHLASSSESTATADEVASLSVALAFHPASGTMVRLNYRTTHQTDVLGNPATRQVALQLGVTTYF